MHFCGKINDKLQPPWTNILFRVAFQSEEEGTGLRCRVSAMGQPHLVLQPVKYEQLHFDPEMYLFYDVLSDSEIQAIKDSALSKVMGPWNHWFNSIVLWAISQCKFLLHTQTIPQHSTHTHTHDIRKSESEKKLWSSCSSFARARWLPRFIRTSGYPRPPGSPTRPTLSCRVSAGGFRRSPASMYSKGLMEAGREKTCRLSEYLAYTVDKINFLKNPNAAFVLVDFVHFL